MRRLIDMRCASEYSGNISAYGTSEGVKKEWDARGRQNLGPGNKSFTGYHHSTVGESRPYHILEGFGKNGGQWAAREAKASRGSRELAVFNSRKEAEAHAHASQD